MSAVPRVRDVEGNERERNLPVRSVLIPTALFVVATSTTGCLDDDVVLAKVARVCSGDGLHDHGLSRSGTARPRHAVTLAAVLGAEHDCEAVADVGCRRLRSVVGAQIGLPVLVAPRLGVKAAAELPVVDVADLRLASGRMVRMGL